MPSDSSSENPWQFFFIPKGKNTYEKMNQNRCWELKDQERDIQKTDENFTENEINENKMFKHHGLWSTAMNFIENINVCDNFPPHWWLI